MAKNYESKAALIEEIKELLNTCQSAVIVDYRGLTVEEDTALRKQFREAFEINQQYSLHSCHHKLTFCFSESFG